MTKINYTDDFYPSSSWVEGVFYNENDKSLVIDLSDELYRYTNVDSASAQQLVTAPSVGAYYNTAFKHQFGPAEHIGFWEGAEFEKVSSRSGATPKALDYSNATVVDTTATKEFSLDTPTAQTDTQTNSEATKEFSLDSPVTSDNYGATKVVVHFYDQFYGKKKRYVGKSTDVNAVLKEFYEFADLFDLEVNVVKVVIKFD